MSGDLALLRAFYQWKIEHQLSTVFPSFSVTAFIQTACISLTPRRTVLSCCYCTDKSLEKTFAFPLVSRY